MEKLICRIVYTAFVVCWSVNGAFVTSPSNVAVLTNNVVVFTCITDSTSSNPVLIDWYYTAVGAGRTLIAANCDVLQQHQSGYRIEGAAPGVCNLTVNSVKLTNAGTFWCQDRESGDFSSAELVVLESLTSSTSATENTAESDVMQYNCSVAFSGSGKISPSIRWTSEGTDVTGGVASTSSSNRADSVYTVTAGTSNIPPCQCDVYFPQTSVSGNDAAQNRPTYADRQDFEEIIVTYCPRNVKIHDVVNDSKIDGGTELSCSAKANPSATFHWTNLTGDVDVTGSSFTVEANTFYVLTCTATNNITYSDGRQQTCSDSYTVTFNTTDVPPTTTPQLTSAAGHEGDKDDLTLILALALGIGIPVLIVIFILLFCCCCPCCPLYDKCCRRGKQNRYDASEHDVGSTDGRSGQVMMDNMGYDDKPPDPYRRPDVVTDNKPPAAYNPPYPQATNPEPVVYAQLQVPDQPRSRTPVVEPSNTVYGNILSA